MATSALERLSEFLAEIGGRGSFAARRTARADDLQLEVTGVGRIRFPISRLQAAQLCSIARPARYGRGEATLLDERVRNTSQIPKSRVRIDGRQWNRTLIPMLEHLRGDLGLPDGTVLKAELHSMLVYQTGQFFLPHQDSEKADAMVGTLVVTLPSSFKGGAFVIEHMGEKVRYLASKQPLSFIAFYADCTHEVRPVTQGYRIVLTYNLKLVRERAADSSHETSTTTEGAPIEALAALLQEHFTTPSPAPRWNRDGTAGEPPNRLVYLLDHQYTERGLAWDHLKGADATRVAALCAAAGRAGCEIALALADVHETWDCEEDDRQPRYSRSRHWYRDDDDEWQEEDDPPPDDPDHYTLGELQDWEISLSRWIDPAGKKTEPISTHVRDEEVCSTTPSSVLEPYRSEYEGYMGNYGNTMDRWYRRAAVVLWSRDRAFAVRAEASPGLAMQTLQKRIRAGAVAEARTLAASLLPFWERVAERETRRGFFDRVLKVAGGVGAPELALSLLQPFRVEALAAHHAQAFTLIVQRYGEEWTRSLLSRWSPARATWTALPGKDRATWLTSLPRLCEALCANQDLTGAQAARLLLHDQWQWLTKELESARRIVPQSDRNEALRRRAPQILAFLEAAVVANAPDVRDDAITFLLAEENEPLLPGLIAVLRMAAERLSPELQHALGLAAIQRSCISLLQRHLAAPARVAGDWSIAAPQVCDCKLCATLAEFLTARDRTRLEWRLAKERRRHVHTIIDSHGLPVRHETLRSGSPYTLVLTKTQALFEREAAARRAWQTDLDWLARRARPSRPSREET
jgi:predicted 2-oxoglutarate/Fe(II)-dependent dioxygenase YbiX